MANLLTGSAPTNLQVHKLCLLYPSRKWAFFFTFKTEVSLNSLDSTQSLSAEWVSNQNTGRSDSITNLTCRSQEKTKLTSNSSNEVGGRQKNNRCSTQTLREKKKTATSFIMFQNCLMLAAINWATAGTAGTFVSTRHSFRARAVYQHCNQLRSSLPFSSSVLSSILNKH